MSELCAIGREESTQRDLFIFDAPSPADVPATLTFPSRYFACLLAWDATSYSDTDIAAIARTLLTSGCVYVCCWGPDCERVHDVFDAEEAALRPDGPFAISTWHNNETLADVLWDVLFIAWPDDLFWGGCRSTACISIGEPAWAGEAREAFLNPAAFSARHLGEEHG